MDNITLTMRLGTGFLHGAVRCLGGEWNNASRTAFQFIRLCVNEKRYGRSSPGMGM